MDILHPAAGQPYRGRPEEYADTCRYNGPKVFKNGARRLALLMVDQPFIVHCCCDDGGWENSRRLLVKTHSAIEIKMNAFLVVQSFF